MLGDAFDLETGGALLLVVFILVMMTLGAVLLVHLTLPKAPIGRKTLLGALIGPNALIFPVALHSIDNSDLAVGVAAMALIMGILSLFIGWPLAHFSNKRLERLAAPSVEIFE